MEQTAVEWLIEHLTEIHPEAFEQAKQMEKEQMCEFTNDYVLTQCEASFEGNVSAEMSVEEYYELTFKSE